MHREIPLLLLSSLLLFGCTPGEGTKLSEAVYFHNDEALETNLSRRESMNLINTIKSLSFLPIQEDDTFPYSYYQYDLSFKIEQSVNDKVYYLEIDSGYLLRRNPMMSSTFSDEVVTLNADQIKVFTNAFDIICQDEDKGIYQETMVVTYDYGFHIPDKLTALLDESLMFFDLTDYGIQTSLIAGDIFKIYYQGEFVTQMTYPGQVDTSRMTILDVRRTRAIILRGSLLGVPGSDNYDYVSAVYSNRLYPNYVVNDDYSFESVNSYHDENVYASFRPDDKTDKPTIQALHSYMPITNI